VYKIVIYGARGPIFQQTIEKLDFDCVKIVALADRNENNAEAAVGKLPSGGWGGNNKPLKFFYPRLASGGYIMVHDYNQYAYEGVKHAVDRFCAEQSVTPVPMTDKGGSVIITKNQ
jgi:hypothetical protein